MYSKFYCAAGREPQTQNDYNLLMSEQGSQQLIEDYKAQINELNGWIFALEQENKALVSEWPDSRV